MEKKVVGYREFYFEMNKLQKKYCIDGDIYIADMNGSSLDDMPIMLGASWTSIGFVSPDDAEKFIAKLSLAIEACRNFKYNGYIIDYYK